MVEMAKKLAGPILGIRRLTTGPLASAAVPEPSPPGLGAALIQALLKLARATLIALIGTMDLVSCVAAQAASRLATRPAKRTLGTEITGLTQISLNRAATELP